MKTSKNKLSTFLTVLVITASFTSCQKEKLDINKSAANVSGNISEIANSEILTAIDVADQSFKNEGCATVTRDMVSMPHVLTIDYGTTGCVARDGKRRQGQLIITFDQANFEVPGVNIVSTFNNYFLDGKEITGNSTKHNDGFNGNHHLTYSVTSHTQIFDPNTSASSTEDAQQVYEILSGTGTPITTDDIHSITGSSNGTDVNGNYYAESITSPIIKKRDPGCSLFYIQGVVVNQTAGQPVRTTDYGTGACDNLANVTVNGVTTTITLH
ncbi:MAG: hypothetical protein U0T74_05495 [Chitinophagales bacterium]